MDTQIVEQMIAEVFSKVDIRIVVALMAIGFVIKHFKFLEKFQNDFIPPFLFLLSFIFSFIGNGFTLEAVFIAIVTGAFAIGLHQSGKNIFTVSIIPNIVNYFKNIISTNANAEPIDTIEEDKTNDEVK